MSLKIKQPFLSSILPVRDQAFTSKVSLYKTFSTIPTLISIWCIVIVVVLMILPLLNECEYTVLSEVPHHDVHSIQQTDPILAMQPLQVVDLNNRFQVEVSERVETMCATIVVVSMLTDQAQYVTILSWLTQRTVFVSGHDISLSTTVQTLSSMVPTWHLMPPIMLVLRHSE